MQKSGNWKNVDEYINSFPQQVHPSLGKTRSIIKSIVPKAEEIFSYNMPAYKQHVVLVYFAA